MHDLIKHKLVYARTSQSTYTSIPVEFPIGIKQVVSLIAIHWALEQLKDSGAAGAGLFMAALSENPNHELTPPGGVAEFQSNPDLYGMVTWTSFMDQSGINRSSQGIIGTQIIPLYGILRPKRQIAVFANIWAVSITGIRGEIYYEEEEPSGVVVDAISRRYGKYRRT